MLDVQVDKIFKNIIYCLRHYLNFAVLTKSNEFINFVYLLIVIVATNTFKEKYISKN